MSGNELRMRPEARSVWLDTLTPDQERAFGAVIDLVGAATKDLPDDEEWRRDPKFDRGLDVKQVSRVLLLGGGRGSGKTTVANTIREALDRSDMELFSKDVRDNLKGRRKDVMQTVMEVRKSVIVLEPLRMADVPGDTNILAALLARIEQLLFPELTREDVPSTGGHGRQHAAVLELLRLQTDVAIAWDGNLRDRRGQLDPDNYAMEEMRVERVRLQLADRFEAVLRRTARESLGHDKPALFLLIVDDADIDPTRLITLLDRLRLVGVSELLVLLVGDIQPIEVAFKLHFADRFRGTAPDITPVMIGMNPDELASLTNLVGRSALRKHLPYHQRVLLQPLRVRDAVRIVPLRRGGEELLALLGQMPVSYPAEPRAPGELWKEKQQAWSAKKAGQLERLEAAQQKAETAAEKVRTLLSDLEDGPGRGGADQDSIDEEKEKLAKELEKAEKDASKASQECDNEARAKLLAQEPMTLRRFVFPTDELADPAEERYWYVGSRVLADSPRVAVDLWHAIRDAKDAEASDVAPKSVLESSGFLPEPDAYRLDPRLHTFVRMLAIERLDANCELWDRTRTALSAKERSQLLSEGASPTVNLVARHTPEDDDKLGTIELADGREASYWRNEGLQFCVKGRPVARVDVGPLVLMYDLTSLENRTLAERSSKRKTECLRWVATPSKRGTADDKEMASAANANNSGTPESEGSSQGPDLESAANRAADCDCRGRWEPWPIPIYRTIRQIEQFGYQWNAFLKSKEDDATRITSRELADAWIAIHTRVLLGRRPAEGAEADPVELDDAKELLLELRKDLRGNEERDGWITRISRDWLKSVRQVLGMVGLPGLDGWVENQE